MIVCPRGCTVMVKSMTDSDYLRCPVCEQRILARYDPNPVTETAPTQSDDDRMYNYDDSHRATLTNRR